jgi:hypothetical protein
MALQKQNQKNNFFFSVQPNSYKKKIHFIYKKEETCFLALFFSKISMHFFEIYNKFIKILKYLTNI